MAKKRNFRTIDQIDEEYYRAHPEEIDSYPNFMAIEFNIHDINWLRL